MTPDAYHQLPGLSSSGARKLLDCPAKFKYELDNPPPPKDVFDFGRVAHRLVLGEGDQYQVVYADSWRSQSARDLRDQARAEGRTPILEKDFNTARAMADALHKSHAADLFTVGYPEQVYQWDDDKTGVPLRAMIDWLPQDLAAVPDYKTAQSADPDKFARAAFDYGYHIQAAWYTTALKAVEGVDAGFVFVVQEKTAPYLVSVVQLEDIALDIGRDEMRRAIDLYHQCETTEAWPGYPTETVTIPTPNWLITRHLEQGITV